MTREYTEDPESGYFNTWTGRHPASAVRTYDLLMAWRDGQRAPDLAEFSALVEVRLPFALLEPVLAQLVGTRVTSLAIELGEPGAELPDELFELAQLERLDVNGNHLRSLPDRFDRLPRLGWLDARVNELEMLPSSLLASRSLVSLDVSSNQLVETPAFDPSGPLEQLDLSWNRLRALAAERLPRGLAALSARGALAELPAGLAELVHLRTLSIGNPVRALPDLRALTRLEELEVCGQLGAALFDALPATLATLRPYGSHRLGLDRIPATIARLVGLRHLVLTFEPIAELPRELRRLELDSLGLSSTQLGDTPTYAYLPDTLRRLELANVGMTRVPPRVRELQQRGRLTDLVLDPGL